MPVHCSAVPAQLLERLRHHGDARVRDAAVRTLAVDRARRAKPAHAQALHARPAAAERVGGCARFVYDCGGARRLPGVLRRSESEPARHDPDVDRAYAAAGTAYEFFERVFGRNSIDGRGMRLVGSVHYGERYDNAFWNGAQMVYGDGDGVVFRSFTSCVDIVAHELAHGVIQSEVPLEASGEAVALRESLADVFGILVKQWSLGETAHAADWIVGSGQFAAGVRAAGLRSFAQPGTAYDDPVLGTDPQAAHMREYAALADERAGAHVNSGIPNHAFYLFAQHLGGRAWETAGRVWYDALRSGLHRRCTFAHFAGATLAVARRHDRRVGAALEAAWDAVGVSAGRAAMSAERAALSVKGL